MSFEDIFLLEISKASANKSRWNLAYRERRNLSKTKLDKYENSIPLAGDGHAEGRYGPRGPRYITAAGLTSGLIFSIYEINSASALVTRIEKSMPPASVFENFFKKFKKPNVEARFIGLQNGDGTAPLYGVYDILSKRKIPICEADLFGDETRNLAMDLKTGMFFNVLVENRLYRPGELKNKGLAVVGETGAVAAPQAERMEEKKET